MYVQFNRQLNTFVSAVSIINSLNEMRNINKQTYFLIIIVK